ncbi:MAG: NUDIX domain-containing protein [Boseongicola sp.]|nr:MAG: NUDIX domain-containing protein [Boseongicola sp.]
MSIDGTTSVSRSGSRIRIAVRGILLKDNKLLLVNAWPDGQSDLLCAPGGGAEPHQSLPDNLRREFYEETGLSVSVGQCVLVNEFHDPAGGFHQVDIYFRCSASDHDIQDNWIDPEGVVTEHHWVTRTELSNLNVKPDSLSEVVWEQSGSASYDPLEPILR